MDIYISGSIKNCYKFDKIIFIYTKYLFDYKLMNIKMIINISLVF